MNSKDQNPEEGDQATSGETLAEKYAHLPLQTRQRTKWSAKTAVPAAIALGAGFQMLSHLIAADGRLPSDWSFYIAMGVAAATVVWFLGVPHQDSFRGRSSEKRHPDPDVQDLIDQKIDIAEYRRRKEAHPPQKHASEGDA